MALRAGSYSASRPRIRGVIREDGYPAYVCIHEHSTFPEARECARTVLKSMGQSMTGPLPEGWREYIREFHTGQ